MSIQRFTRERVLVLECADEHDEAEAIADMVADALARGLPPREVGLLFRVNAQARPIERALIARAVPHVVVRGVAFAERAEVRDVLALLRLVRSDGDDAAFRRVVGRLGRGVGPRAVERLAAHGSLLPAARLGVLPPRYHSGVARIIATVDGLRAQPGDVSALARSAWRSLGFGEQAETTHGELLATLLDVARRSPTLEALLDGVTVDREPESDVARDAVSLVTLHGAKGLEYSLVCIAGMEEGLLPHRRALDDPAELEEERRLCYVGMTRAKDRLVLSYAVARVALGELSIGARSRFLDEIPAALVELRRTEAASARQRPLPDLRVGQRVRHRRWGEGTVERLEQVDGQTYVTIAFADRSRRMQLVYAPLERVED